ncbi:MAG: sigma-54 dependent transcriptional regulator [Candidatus Omnitrophota bacterium]
MSPEINKYRILIVDDEPLIRNSLYEILRIEGYQAFMSTSAEEAIKIIHEDSFDIVITDLKLPKMSGIDLLIHIKEKNNNVDVILVTGFGTIETAVEAMKKGAYDYITKPINDNEIKLIIKKIIEKKEILEENRNLRQLIAKTNRTSFCDMIGGSDKMQKVYHIIESVASSHATVMISGESGTGKGLVATAVHQMDHNRSDKPFVEVSCGALSETLLESELFGHVRGAFTGAIKDKIGRFEYAKDGTIFLDEIDAFSPNLQVKLLRVLQDNVFERVGENETRKTSARIIVATNQNLADLVMENTFREDLFYRINVIAIEMPPLRERKDDIDALSKYFIEKYSKKNNKTVENISDEVRKLFMEYSWPGNVRELENAIEGAVIMTKTHILNKWDFPNASKFDSGKTMATNGKSLKDILEKPEREVILSALNETNWNRNKAAAHLGINRTTLYNKMKKYSIPFKKGQ